MSVEESAEELVQRPLIGKAEEGEEGPDPEGDGGVVESAVSDKVPLRVRLSYVSVSFALEMAATIWNLLALNFMTDVALLSPGLVAGIGAIYRFWDASNDVVIGGLSDRTQSERWGRRRGWMLGGSLPYAVAYFMMWVIPSSNMTVLFFYFLLVKCLADLCFTSINVAQIALVNDLSKDHKERFQINIMRFAFTGVGSLFGILLYAFVAKTIPNPRERYFVQALVVSIIIFLSIVGAVWQTKPYSKCEPLTKKQVSIFSAFKTVIKVKTALLAIGIYVGSVSALQSTLFMVPYLLKDILAMSDLQMISVILAAQLAGFSVVGILLKVSKTQEKRTIFFIGGGLWMLFYLLLPFLSKDNVFWLYPLGVLLGVGLATSLIIPIALVTDASDFVELQTGLKQEGMLFGVMHMLNKIVLGGLVFVFEQSLSSAGFQKTEEGDQTLNSASITTIKVSMSVIPLIFLSLAMTCNYFIPIRNKRLEEVREELNARTLRPQGRSPGDPPYMTYFLIDGMNHKVFNELLQEGSVPNIAQMIKQGTYVEKGVTAFPSMTGYAYYAAITGQDSANSGVLGLRWFNRSVDEGKQGLRNYVGRTNVWMNRDIAERPETVFEVFKGQHSYTSQSYMNRGVEVSDLRGWSLTSAKLQHLPLFKFIKKIPCVPYYDWDSYEDEIIDAAIQDLQKVPKVQWITFVSTDSYHHVHGADAKYKSLIVYIDSLIGKYRQASRELGQEDDRIYWVFTDHGAVDVTHNIDLGKQIQATHGLKYTYGSNTYVTSAELKTSITQFDEFDLVIAINGNTTCYVYVKHPEMGFLQPVDIRTLMEYPCGGREVNLVEEIASMTGVEFVLTKGKDENTTLISCSSGSSLITSQDGKRFAYRVLSGVDPLEYPKSLHSVTLTAEEWLQRTYDTTFPYAPVRVWRLMNTTAASIGDIVVTSLSGYDFGKDFEMFVGNYRGGHGGLRNDQTTVPFILTGKGIASGVKLATASVEDMGATVLNRLGADTSELDGTVIKQALA